MKVGEILSASFRIIVPGALELDGRKRSGVWSCFEIGKRRPFALMCGDAYSSYKLDIFDLREFSVQESEGVLFQSRRPQLGGDSLLALTNGKPKGRDISYFGISTWAEGVSGFPPMPLEATGIAVLSVSQELFLAVGE